MWGKVWGELDYFQIYLTFTVNWVDYEADTLSATLYEAELAPSSIEGAREHLPRSVRFWA